MLNDETVEMRQFLCALINVIPLERAELEKIHGQVWDTKEVSQDFELVGFAAPLVVARRKSDGKLGSLYFQANPRLYFKWEEDKP